MDGLDGCIPVFACSDPGMSFVRYDSQGLVREVAEKKVLSSWASVGLYGFRTAAFFRSLYREAYQQNQIAAVGGEEYVAPIYALALRAGARISAPRVSADHVHILGTPRQLLRFDETASPPLGR
jgi:hypothetical protein